MAVEDEQLKIQESAYCHFSGFWFPVSGFRFSFMNAQIVEKHQAVAGRDGTASHVVCN